MAAAYRFGPVEVRPAERQLLVEGRPAPVGARAFDLLLALIDHRDRVVSKDELLEMVWPGVVVEENNLQVQVSTLRKILGAGAVATIPGRGYRFTLLPEGADAAPSCPLPARNHNLPAALNSFIGREREIAEIESLLGSARLVTVTSIGGTGKTRLSLQLAGELLDDYPDGIWFVELAPVSDERRVPQAVASVLGVKEEAGLPVAQALVKHVKDRRLLLLLDNCEHLSAACAELAKLLLQAGAGLRILASSREPLHVAGEVTFRLPALAFPENGTPVDAAALPRYEAIRLFVDRARAANPAFEVTAQNARAVAEVCRRLDGIPLAIELAAARVRSLSVDKVAERLDDCFRVLTGGDSTALPHQQTLRASIDWSYNLLSMPERTLLRRLAVFVGGWTLEAAEAVGERGAGVHDSVMELLSQLVEKSLVAVDSAGERYRLLETVRQYALERLAESGEESEIRLWHLNYYLALASRARENFYGADGARWLGRVDAELENILVAHRWCASAEGGDELGLRLVSSIRQYWLSRGLLGVAHGITVGALSRSPQRSRSRCRALFDAGQLAYFMGNWAEARAHLEESLAIARDMDDPASIGRALQPLGMACVGMGQAAQGRKHLEEGLALARTQDDPRNVLAAVNMLAQFYRTQGELDAAEPLYAHVLDLAREMQDRESVAIGLLNLAMVAVDRRREASARELLAEALAIARDVGSRPAEQSVLEVCAGLAAMGGQWECAARFFGAAERQASQTGIHRDPADEAFLEPWMSTARAALGKDAFARAEGTGRARAFDDSLDEARDWIRR